jgi:hypothetical protein
VNAPIFESGKVIHESDRFLYAFSKVGEGSQLVFVELT